MFSWHADDSTFRSDLQHWQQWAVYLLAGVEHAQFGALLLGVHQHVEHGADRQRHPEVCWLIRFLHFGIKCRFCSVGQNTEFFYCCFPKWLKWKLFSVNLWHIFMKLFILQWPVAFLKTRIYLEVFKECRNQLHKRKCSFQVFCLRFDVFRRRKNFQPSVLTEANYWRCCLLSTYNKERNSQWWMWSLSLTSWRRPPSCRWPSVWVFAPDVWRTRALASGGPARTSAERPASRTNPLRWPSRYCREDGHNRNTLLHGHVVFSDMVENIWCSFIPPNFYFGNIEGSVSICLKWPHWLFSITFTFYSISFKTSFLLSRWSRAML